MVHDDIERDAAPKVIAVLSDIHGNARALEAVVEDLMGEGIEDVINLGDSLYGPFDPRPVADLLLATGWPTVSGNEDRCLIEPRGLAVSATARFTRERLASEHVAWLERLPATFRHGGVLAFHGSPPDDTAYLLSRPDGMGKIRAATANEIDASLEGASERVILCGHDHLPRTVRLKRGPTIVNPGSVGCPAYTDDHPVSHAVENGSPHARYAIVRIRSGPTGEVRIDVEQRSVGYDWDAAAREAESNGFSDWASWIATGRAKADLDVAVQSPDEVVHPGEGE